MGPKKLKVKKNLFQNLKQFIKHSLHRLQGIDQITLILVAVLFSIGLLMIYSITSISIYNGAEGDPIHYLKKTLLNAFIGIAGMVFVLLIPYRGLKNLSLVSVFVCPLLLIATLLFGKGSGASDVKSWFEIGPLNIQPAEFVKVGMILSMAWMISRRIDKGTYYFKRWRLLNGRLLYDSYVSIIGYFGVCTLLVLLQPDFGSALILGFIGLIAFLSTGVKWIPYRGLKNLSLVSVFVCPLLLIATLLFGKGSGASDVKSWFEIGPLNIQPAEFVKVGMILSMAWMISRRIDKGTYYFKRWRLLNGRLLYDSYVSIIGYFGVCTLLVLLQPDFGSALILGFIGLIAFLSTGVKWQSLWPIVVLGIIVVVAGAIVLAIRNPYQLERFHVWLDPFNHDKGFQNVMGYTAIALGGMTGVGIGNSTQKYGYVLEPHNDMISTIIAEELGVWVILLIMVIYFIIAIRCFLTAVKSKDIYASIVCIGIGSIFLVQPVVNLGGASGAIPLTGVTLPFISYGGSSIMSLFIAIGVYFNVRMEIIAQQKRLKKKREQSVKLKVVPFPKS